MVEHWLRINYSQKHFTRNGDTIYSTDERGIIYVKYGKPDSIYTRELAFDQTSALLTAKELLEKEINHDFEPGVHPLDPSGKGGGYVFIEDTGYYRHLVKLAKRLHGQPKVTIWVYDQLPNPRWDSTIFIFGERRNGPFQMLSSLEQLLDGAIYQKLRYQGTRFKTPPVFLAQHQLYESVRDIAPILADRYSDIEQKIFLPNQKITLLDAFDIRDQSFISFNRSYLNTSKQASLFANTLPSLPTRIQQYRMINPDSNKPYILTSVFAYPLKPTIADFLGDYSKNKSYTLSTVYQPLETDSNRQYKTVSYDLANLDTNSSIVTIFQSHADKKNQVQISSELSRPAKFTDYRGLETNIKATQKSEIESPTPLNTDQGTLEMSDLIVGYSNQEKRQHIPFVITANNSIPKNENLKIKFEVYHLAKDTSGRAGVVIDYSVRPQKGFFKRLFSSKENRVSLSLNFDTRQDYLSQVLEVATEKFSPGDYELSLDVHDLNSEQSVKRTVTFTISED